MNCIVPDSVIETVAPALEEPCEHRWRWVRDWYGDPNVINGTCDCSHFECTKCGSTDCDDPPDDHDDDFNPNEE